ncbi:AcrR family transcriptional regulator [Pseudomonas sp. BIGb0408]|uniref:AcrR family transcriptional regulator n=1 Tax=Phytopseudomonas flavescens TaxID=29435 RepID=A0A7Y9XLS9_9GAMM|nr:MULTISPECIES: TetR/AcrR family transcriptional regulator [Pseudomonas]MCW2293121.1 AcrR family transcriptional regulator [Pseudomonas sp. BIGb0408]NYH72309.1 AcrR family transcriptional regulator [Pseudomonas flavescens]
MNSTPQLPIENLFNIGEAASRQAKFLIAAGRVFIEHGYDGASMEEIAKAAEVTRPTLYNRFPDGKESLFFAVVERIWQAFPAMNVPKDKRALNDPRAGLRRIATEFAVFWEGPMASDFLRMIFLESKRFPQLSRRFEEIIEQPVQEVVCAYFVKLARRNILVVHDPEVAARHFLGMIDGLVILTQIRGNREPLDRAEIEVIVERTVDIFIRSYEDKSLASGVQDVQAC